jgi:putative transposase
MADDAGRSYELGSWVIMPSHVHVLRCPTVDIVRIVSGIKVASAKAANRLLGRTGAFWSRDYFYRRIRNSIEEQRVIRYIENNPVKADLCIKPESWQFSSAHGQTQSDSANGDAPIRRVAR